MIPDTLGPLHAWKQPGHSRMLHTNCGLLASFDPSQHAWLRIMWDWVGQASSINSLFAASTSGHGITILQWWDHSRSSLPANAIKLSVTLQLDRPCIAQQMGLVSVRLFGKLRLNIWVLYNKLPPYKLKLRTANPLESRL